MPASNIPEIIGNFLDGQVVTANTMPYALNPKLETIRTTVNDHATRIDTLTSQVSALGGLIYNVVAYGADPTGVNDSTTAIQNCVNAATAQQGIVVFSNGIYKISVAITISGTCYITSDGAGQGVTIYQLTAGQPIFSIQSSYVRITDLKLDVRSSNMAGYAIIDANSVSSATLLGIFIQRCQFYTTTSTILNAIKFYRVVGGAITDCLITGESTYTSTGIEIRNSSNILVSRNTMSVLSQAVNINAIWGTSVTTNNNIIIEQNTVSSTKTNSYSIKYTTAIFVEKNTMATITGIDGTYNFIDVDTCAQVSVYDNIFNHFASATTYYHRGIYLTATSYVIIARNYFYYGGTVIYPFSSVSYIQILNNYILEPNSHAMAISTLKSCLISGNTIIDVWSANATSSAAIFITQGGIVTVVGNTLVRGTRAGASVYINFYGIRFPAGPVDTVFDGNDFSVASSPVSQAFNNPCVYYIEPTGKKVYYTPTDVAPTTGTWTAGTKVLVSAPSAGGYTGYVCTVAGTPGTWKGFGDVQP